MQGGGIDTLNVLIPQEQEKLYNTHRPKLAIDKEDQLLLDSSTTLGVHPAASAIRELYQMGVARIVQQVAYPNPNQSHFESTDIVIGGGDGNAIELQGSWIGRFLQSKYTNYPAGFPNENMDSPPGLGFGWAIPKIVWSAPGSELGIKLQGSPDLLYEIGQIVNQDKGEGATLTRAQQKIAYINAIDTQADRFGAALKNAYDAGVANQTSQTYLDGPISRQLRDVAKTIIGGSEVEVYVVSIGVFDTHDNQVLDVNNNTSGPFANSINDVYEGILSFQKELMQAGKADEVLLMTYSEFGRRVVENAGRGTDHGTAYSMMLVGTQVNPGISGDNPDLANLDANGDFANWNYDYRQVLTTILSDWMGAGPMQLAAAGLLGFDGVPNLIETPVVLESRDLDYRNTLVIGSGPVDPDPDPVDPIVPSTIPPVRNLRVDNITEDSFSIFFDLPDDMNGIEVYPILVNDTLLQNSHDGFAMATGLNPDTDYTVKVASQHTDGRLSEYIEITVKTLVSENPVDPDPIEPDPVDPVNGEAVAQVAKRVDDLASEVGGIKDILQAIKDAI